MNKDTRPKGVLAQNRRGRFDYEIEDEIEAGIVLLGSEIKSLRRGGGSLTDAYASVEHDKDHLAIYLINCHIAPYDKRDGFTSLISETKRPRKLLLHKTEIAKMIGKVQRKGYSLIPLSIYLNHKGVAKLSLAIAKGKKQHDKRATIKARDIDRLERRE